MTAFNAACDTPDGVGAVQQRMVSDIRELAMLSETELDDDSLEEMEGLVERVASDIASVRTSRAVRNHLPS
jgi:hypothetical protein